MTDVFFKVLDMSIAASWVIVAVLLVRLLLKRAPKIFSYLLWAAVLFRLLCPVSFTGPVSLLEVSAPRVTERMGTASSVSYIRPEPEMPLNPTVDPMQIQEQENGQQTLAILWAAGAAGMLLWSLVSWLRLRWQLIGSQRQKEAVYLADHIPSAFVLGLIRPRIYLPSQLTGQEQLFVLTHEWYHIRRGDHVVKPLAYLALCLHWFNPLVWLAFSLAGKDMEMSCDEAVIGKLDADMRSAYSQTLLRLSVSRGRIPGTLLSFGEGDTKGRIRNMAKWKKPKLWLVILLAVLCLGIGAVCILNPNAPEGGGIAFCLPADYTVEQKGREMDFYREGMLLGGVNCYDYPGYDPFTQWKTEEWMRELGVPKAIAGGYDTFSGGSTCGAVMETSFYHPSIGESIHYFFVREELVYELWLDRRYVTQNEEAAIQTSVVLEEESGPRILDYVQVVENPAKQIPEGQYLKLVVTRDETNTQSFSSQELGGAFSQGMTYSRVRDVLHIVGQNHYPLEQELQMGMLTKEDILADARKDAREGYCEESYESRHGVTGITFRYPEFSMMWMDDVYEKPDGESYPVSYLCIYDHGVDGGARYHMSPITGFMDWDTGQYIDREDWGVEFTVIAAAPTGITLRCTQSGGQQIGTLQVAWYHLSTQEGFVPKEEIEAEILNLPIPMEQETEFAIDFTTGYSPLPRGEYTLLLYLEDQFEEDQVHPLMEDYYTIQQYSIAFTVS